jgi:Class II flagellar assembly regulator
MRIQGPATALAPASSPAGKRAASGTFSLEAESAARSATATSGTRSIGGIDALLALQGVEEPSERRRKAVKRGKSALDALDALKLGLLSGTFDTGALARLKSVTASLAEPSGDPTLDAVLAEIELRAQVELAKIGLPQSGPKEAA